MLEVRVKTYLLTVLFITALGLRLLFFTTFLNDNPVQLSFDSGHYHNVATQLAQGNGYVNNNGTPHFYRLPGYPLFLASCYKIFGNSVQAALIVQMILSSIIPILIYVLSLLLFPGCPLVAIASALIAILHPGFLIFSGLVMSDALFTIFFLLFFIFFMRSNPSRRPMGSSGRAQAQLTARPEERGVQPSVSKDSSMSASSCILMAGLFLGMSALVRPGGCAFLLVACLILVLNARFFRQVQDERKQNGTIFRSNMTDIFQFLSGWLLIVTPWLFRNFMFTGSLFFSTLSGPHMINHGAVRVLMAAQQCSWLDAHQKVVFAVDALKQQSVEQKGRLLHEVEASNIAEHYAHAICLQYPLHTIKLCLINIFKTLFSLYSSELLFIDSGGQLPAYSTERSLCDSVMRFFRPNVHNRYITWVIYAEIIVNFLILLGFLGFCAGYVLCLINLIFKRKFYSSARPEEPTTWASRRIRAHVSFETPFGLLRTSADNSDIFNSWHYQVFTALAFIVLILLLSCICGFARLRLPIEPFFIMLSLMFWRQFLGKERVV